MTARRRITWALLAALVVLAAFLRLEYQSEVAALDLLARAPQGDEKTFAEWGHRAAAGTDAAVPYQAPLYPTLLGALERAGADPGRDVRLLQALLGLVAAGLAARIAFEATRDPRAAAVAFFLAAFARPLLHAEGTLLRESASAAVLAAAALAYARVRTRSRVEDHLALGLALGLGLVLRENFAVVTLVVLAERLVALARSRDRAALGKVVILAVALSVPVLPFDVKNVRLGDGIHPLPNWNPGCVFYLANRRDNATAGGYEPPRFVRGANVESEVEGFTAEARRRTGHDLRGHEVSAYWLKEGLAEIAAAPATFAWRVAMRALASVAPWESPHQRDVELDMERSWVLRAPLLDMGLLVALAVTGLVFSLGRKPPSPTLPPSGGEGVRAILILLGAWWLSLLAAAFTTRYRVPATPLLAVAGALAARSIAERLRRRGFSALVAALLLVGGGQALRLLRVPPDHSNALRTRALAALELAAKAKTTSDRAALRDTAAADLERSVKDRPPDVSLQLLLADTALAQAQDLRSTPEWLHARTAYEDVTRHDAAPSRAWQGLALCELVLGRPHAAVSALERADAHDPDVKRLLDRARAKAAESQDRPLPLPPR